MGLNPIQLQEAENKAEELFAFIKSNEKLSTALSNAHAAISEKSEYKKPEYKISYFKNGYLVRKFMYVLIPILHSKELIPTNKLNYLVKAALYTLLVNDFRKYLETLANHLDVPSDGVTEEIVGCYSFEMYDLLVELSATNHKAMKLVTTIANKVRQKS